VINSNNIISTYLKSKQVVFVAIQDKFCGGSAEGFFKGDAVRVTKGVISTFFSVYEKIVKFSLWKFFFNCILE